MAIDGLGELKLDEKFTNINPDELPDELKDTYKNMQSHFTKSNQAATDAKKKYDAGITVLADEKSALETELADLKTSNTQLQTSLNAQQASGDDDDILKFLEGLGDGDDGGGGSVGRSPEDAKLIAGLTSTVKNLQTQFTALEQATDEKTSKALKVIQYEHDLAAVAETHQETFGEKLDRQALIDHALEIKQPDFYQAYEAFTRDRLIDKKANERADVLYKERVEKDEDFSTGAGGHAPRLFARSEETPKTMSAATASILKEMRTKVK